MTVNVLRSVTIMINCVFCGATILTWLYLLVSSIMLRISTRNMEEEERKNKYERVFTLSLKDDLPVVQKTTRKAFLIMCISLLVIWLFGTAGEQETVSSLFERISVWLFVYVGMGIGTGTLMSLIVPPDISVPCDIARRVRKGGSSCAWLIIVYYVIIWLIA